MADILIKNYPMPKEGVFNLLIYPEGDVFYVNPYNEAVCSTNATAIELPEHGRLVQDTDVKALVFSGLSFDRNPRRIIEDYIDKLPTIVEAST